MRNSNVRAHGRAPSRIRRAVLSSACVGTLAVAAVVGPAAIAADSPDDLGTPTPDLLRQSVQAWDPEGSVQTWTLRDSVKPLVEEKDDDAKSVITLTSDILFEFGSAKIPKNAAKAVASAVRNVPNKATVKVSGFTDSIGDTAANKKLSRERAQAVAEVIADARPDLKVTAKGYGEARPVAANTKNGKDNPEGRAKNRRVEIRYAK